MKIIILVLACILPTMLCWDYPGYPGEDCHIARKEMLAQKDPRWMIPKCNEDGTFVDLQCYEEYPSICMCVLPDGSPLTLPGFGLEITTCVCVNDMYKIYEYDRDAEMPKCANDGSYVPLQCSKATGECWCVNRNGTILIPPSIHVTSCN